MLSNEQGTSEQNWIDVTSFLFKVTSNELAIGEMIHHETNFSLTKVMQAIEIMDPKMDTSMFHSSSPILNLSERLERKLVPSVSELNIKQIIQIMDELLCAEYTWFDGSSLPQTVFTCVYFNYNKDNSFEHLDSELDKIMQSNSESRMTELLVRSFVNYCRALIKGIDEIRSVVMKSECKEEEEFIYNPLGCSLGQKYPIKKLLNELNNLEEELSNFYHEQQNNNESNETLLLTRALLARLAYRNAFYHLHYYLHTPSNIDFASIRKFLTSAKKNLKTICDTYNQLQKMKSKSNGNNSSDSSSVNNGDDISFAFDKHMIKFYNSVHPLKPIDLLKFENQVDKAAIDYLLQLESLITSMQKLKQHCSLEQLIHFFRNFSESKPHVLVRCRLMHLLIVDQKVFNGPLRLQTIIVNYLKDKVPSMTPYHKKALQSWDSDESFIVFIDLFANTLYRLFNEFCNNRSYLRRRLLSLFSVDLPQLESKAESLDYSLITENGLEVKQENFTITFTIIQLITTCIEDYLKLGFELELYHHTEYKYIYWYLEYILFIKIQNSKKINTPSAIPDNTTKELSMKKKSKKKNKKVTVNNTNSDNKTNDPETMKEKGERIMSEALILLCRAIIRTIIYLTMNGQYTNSSADSLPFGSEEKNYKRRFDILSCLPQPPVKKYEEFKTNTTLDDVPLDQLLHFINEHYIAVAQLVDSCIANANVYQFNNSDVAFLKSLQKIANTNRVSLTLAQKYKIAGDTGKSGIKMPTFDFSQSYLFPIIKLPK
jgi:hypothetical protein